MLGANDTLRLNAGQLSTQNRTQKYMPDAGLLIVSSEPSGRLFATWDWDPEVIET